MSVIALAAAPSVASAVTQQIELGPTQACVISGEGDIEGCAEASFPASDYATDVWRRYRTLLRFDAPARLPAGAVITGARLHVDYESGPVEQLQYVEARALTSDWTAAADWLTSDGTEEWDPGSQFVMEPIEAATDTAESETVDPPADSKEWDVRDLLVAWRNGAQRDFGVLLKGATDAHGPVFVVNPRLIVDYIADVTPPPAPEEFDVFRDPDSGGSTISFEQPDDAMTDPATPGSGVVGWRLRYRLQGGAWTDWFVDDDDFTIPSTSTDQVYDIEAVAIDGAGNESSVAHASVTIPPLWTQGELDAIDAAPDVDYSTPYDPDDYDAEIEDDDEPSARTLDDDPTPGDLGELYEFEHCLGGVERAAASQLPQCKQPDAMKKTARKKKELSCSKRLRKYLGPRRASQLCRTHWTWVYRLLDWHTKRVVYVGITYDMDVRCSQHGYGLTSGHRADCQEMLIVPNRAAALSVEQYLMEVYGFRLGPVANKNFNYDIGDWFFAGWFDNNVPALRNRVRNFSAKKFRALYCAAIVTGSIGINLFNPRGIGRLPPDGRDLAWWPNFPARDCYGVGTIQDVFADVEGRAVAHPRS